MIFAKNFARNCEKNKSWNIRRLVAGSFVQTNQRLSVIYYRLTYFKIRLDYERIKRFDEKILGLSFFFLLKVKHSATNPQLWIYFIIA